MPHGDTVHLVVHFCSLLGISHITLLHTRSRFRKNTENRSTWVPSRPCSTIPGSSPLPRSRTGSCSVLPRSNSWRSKDVPLTSRRSGLRRPNRCPKSRNVRCPILRRENEIYWSACASINNLFLSRFLGTYYPKNYNVYTFTIKKRLSYWGRLVFRESLMYL